MTASTVRWTVRKELVPGAGIEPARRKAPDFKSGMSTNFIIRALLEQALQPITTLPEYIPKR